MSIEQRPAEPEICVDSTGGVLAFVMHAFGTVPRGRLVALALDDHGAALRLLDTPLVATAREARGLARVIRATDASAVVLLAFTDDVRAAATITANVCGHLTLAVSRVAVTSDSWVDVDHTDEHGALLDALSSLTAAELVWRGVVLPSADDLAQA